VQKIKAPGYWLGALIFLNYISQPDTG